jgi:hypothetical protein
MGLGCSEGLRLSLLLRAFAGLFPSLDAPLGLRIVALVALRVVIWRAIGSVTRTTMADPKRPRYVPPASRMTRFRLASGGNIGALEPCDAIVRGASGKRSCGRRDAITRRACRAL